MKIKQKVGLIVLITVLVIAGLFVLRSYFGNKLGVFADLLTDEKIILAKTVAAGDFDNASLTNLTKVGTTLQIQGQGSNQVCGNYPGTVSLSGMPDTTNFNLSLTPVTSSTYEVTNFVDNYYIGNELKTQSGGGTYPLKPNGDDINIDNPGFSVTRGPGWVQVQLDKPAQVDAYVNRNAVEGSITFPTGISLNADSIYYQVGGDGPVGADNGSHDLSSTNDEVTLVTAERKVSFFLATAINKDTFIIKYCFNAESAFEGTVSGQVDLGAEKPISSLRVATTNFLSPRDEVIINTQISKNGTDWVTGQEVSGLRYNFQGETPRDSYCYRYIKYTIKLKTSSTDPSTAVALNGLDIYGGDTCGTESGTPGGTQCSNGIDDDGDGKIDALVETGDNDRFTFSDAWQIRSFVNSFSEYIDIPESGNNAGALRADDATALKICNLKGYATAENYTNGSYNTCGDNSIAYWDPTINDFKLVNACQFNSYISTLTCFNSSPACRDGIDNNGDGKIDYPNDPGCASANDTSETQNDPSCSGPSDDSEAEQCNNTLDDDSDGLIDVADPGCWTDRNDPNSYDMTDDNEGDATSECQDGIDNDGNELIDYPNDPNCSSALDDSEQPSTPGVVYLPGCANGIDDDGDGLVDFPADKGCESIIDDDESETKKVCKVNDTTNINFTLSEFSQKIAGTSSGSLVAGDGTAYKYGDTINLVTNGETIIDNSISSKSSPSYIKRGPGYVYLLFKNGSDSSALVASGKLIFSGVKITKAINSSITLVGSSTFFIGSPFEKQGDGVIDAATNNDEFSINEAGTEFTFGSAIGNGSDAVYIYYDYVPTADGGCQCQDGIDNDNNGLIDYPNDPGCSTVEDNEEKTNLAVLASQPASILPSLISSGPGFWILVAIILLISGISIYVIIKRDKNKAVK